MNPKAGCAGSILNLLQMKEFNHQAELQTGILGEECSQMMKAFFKELREKEKNRALRFERRFTDVTLIVNSAQAPLRHPEGSV